MQGPRVLLVCEEGNTASDLAGRLRELGYAVPGPFVTVREALAELEEGVRPDLFLLDLDLQGDLSGKVLARLVRERFDLPVVFLGTGERGEEDPEEVDSFGYLGKPVRDRELAAALLMALHRRDLETRLRETELRHRAFLDNLKTEVAVFRRDAQGAFRLRELNRAAERRRGEDRESLLGRTCEEYLPELGDWLRERLHRVVRSGKGEDFSLPLREETGVQWREGAVFPLQAGEAGVLFRDVTVLRRQTEALMRSARDLTERLRECRSLLEIARTLQEPFLALDERLCRAAELVPRAFRAPETLEARILLGDREYATRHFLNTPWSTSQGIFVEGALEGAVEVCRRTLEEPDQEERFLREELDFLRSLAGLLGQTVQREREIRRAEQVRDLAFAGLLLEDPCAGVLLLDPQGRVLEAEFPDRTLSEGLRRVQGCRLDEVVREVEGALPEASPEAEGVLSLSLGGEEGVRPGRWRRLGRPEAGEPGGFLLRLGVPEAR